MRKPELLVPASSLEVLKIATVFGADAVYIGGEAFGLRAKARNFSKEEMAQGIAFAHEHGVKVYVTVNILAHNYDLAGVREYLKELKELKPDALIIADPGIFTYAKEICPEIERHISTQANNTNYETYRFWYKLGAKRVVTARELSLEEIRQIRANIPDDMEIETFIHGAMCTSYSGRCVLSNYVTKRDSNRGGCSQVCRFTFNMDDNNDFQIASKDLSMIDYLEDLINIGVSSLKIEGRMRSMYYIATVVDSYKKVRDMVINNTLTEEKLNYYKKVLNRVSNRENRPQFFDKEPGVNEQYYTGREEASNQDFLGLIKKVDDLVTIEQRNNFKIGDEIEVFGPNTAPQKFTLEYMVNEKMEETNVARHPIEILYIKVPFKVNSGDILRVPID